MELAIERRTGRLHIGDIKDLPVGAAGKAGAHRLAHERAGAVAAGDVGRFDCEDVVDVPDRLDRQRRLSEIGQFKELAAAMAPTGRLDDRRGTSLRLIEFTEPGIGIGLQDTGPAREMPSRVLAAAIARVEEQGSRRIMAAERPVVPDIGPQPRRHGLVLRQHRHRRVVAVKTIGGQHMAADQFGERRQRGATRTDPVGQGRGVQLDALPGVNLALPVQRLVLAELGVEDHR